MLENNEYACNVLQAEQRDGTQSRFSQLDAAHLDSFITHFSVTALQAH